MKNLKIKELRKLGFLKSSNFIMFTAQINLIFDRKTIIY